MKGAEYVAEMMAIAARTAPKSRGEDFVMVEVISDKEKITQIAECMLQFGEKRGKKGFDRDSKGVMASEAIVLIGLKDAKIGVLDCGACGYEDCASFLKAPTIDVEFKGPYCAYRLLDMGIALGSAVKMASMLNVDNRIMYRIGAAVRDAKIVDWDFVMGIPLSVSGKNIFFDRKS